MEEIWKDVVGYEGLYLVSNIGRVKSLGRDSIRVCRWGQTIIHKVPPKIMTPSFSHPKYPAVTLWKEGRQSPHRIHRLVAQAFISNPNNYKDINHKDGNKNNNHVDNLEWCTRQHNILHAYKNGLAKQHLLGDKDPRRKAVLQYDLNNNFVAEYSGRHEAARQTGIKQTAISACCTGKSKEAGGFKWISKDAIRNYS